MKQFVMQQELSWEVGWARQSDLQPAEFVPAVVPGAVQLDWAHAQGWPEFWRGENFKAYHWMEDVYWTYRARLNKPALAADQRLMLVCTGVDYACEVRVAGRVVLTHEGMFSCFETDLTPGSDGAVIEIIVSPVPKTPLPAGAVVDDQNRGRREARQCCKPAVSYGWDFHPRLIPLGIWDETYLQVRTIGASLDSVEVACELADDLSSASLRLVTEGNARCVRWTLHDPYGSVVNSLVGEPGALAVLIDKPMLWWPSTEGEPALYTSIVETIDFADQTIERFEQRFGIRRIKLVMYPGQIDQRVNESQPTVPITFEVNGRSIFARGANWVCPEIFPGTLTKERYREQLELFAGANFNLVRCWGGAIVNKTAFFDLCDELGILVWQEFPLSCNNYEGTPEYLRILDQESKAIIKRRRRHACVALWCGGNELFNGWSGMNMQDLALRLLDRNCFDLDPARPFLPTSPLVGIRHGDYRFRMGDTADARTVFDLYPSERATAYAEFGVPGPAAVSQLTQIIPEPEIWPVHRSPSWSAHHAFDAWYPGNSWLFPEVADYYFGPSDTLEQLVDRLQLLQAQGYKAIYEEGRRQKPVCSLVACWVFNEPWPCAANNSLVSWPNTPKPAYHAVASANRPLMASARIPRFDWVPGGEFCAQLFLLNDTPRAVDSMEVQVYLKTASGQEPISNWSCPGTGANTHCAGPVVRGTVPERNGETFELIVEVVGRPELSSNYTLAFSRAVKS
jgi:beta-mannosidase